MKTYYNKQKTSIVKYRKFNNFSNYAFLKDLKSLLSKFDNEKNVPISSLKETVNRTLEKHAPFKGTVMQIEEALINTPCPSAPVGIQFCTWD